MHLLSKMLFKPASVRLNDVLHVLRGRIHDNSQFTVLRYDLYLRSVQYIGLKPDRKPSFSISKSGGHEYRIGNRLRRSDEHARYISLCDRMRRLVPNCRRRQFYRQWGRRDDLHYLRG